MDSFKRSARVPSFFVFWGVRFPLPAGSEVSHVLMGAVVLWLQPRGQDTNFRDLESDLNMLICPASRSRDLESGLRSMEPDIWSDVCCFSLCSQLDSLLASLFVWICSPAQKNDQD